MLKPCRNEVSEIEAQYSTAMQAGYNRMAKLQVDLVRRLCQIDSLGSISLIARLMEKGNNHEYMSFALPDLLEEHWAYSKHKEAIGEAFIYGMKHGQNEDLKSGCIHKLLKASYASAYEAVAEYQSFLRFNQSERPDYWQSLLALVDYAEKQLQSVKYHQSL